MSLFVAIPILIFLATATPAWAIDEACAEFRRAKVELDAIRTAEVDSRNLLSEEGSRAFETFFHADRKVRYLSDQLGFGARTTVEVVEHLEETADLAQWAVHRWLAELPQFQVATEVSTLARRIDEDANRLEAKLAELLCQMHEAGIDDNQK